jgi:hypothetical protein
VALAGLGMTVGLSAIIGVLAVLTVVTVFQRIRHVWRLSAATTPDKKEN